MAITTLESLREHLQWAIEIEHATIPPYLNALYSIKVGHNQEAFEVIESVLMEEMLHMTLAANVLNAIGGVPVIDKPGFIAQYPTFLPHSTREFMVPLVKFSKGAVDIFMQIERPEEHDAIPEDNNFHTIGQFYDAIEQSLIALCKVQGEETIFCGNPARQIRSDSTYYGGSGIIIPVTDLKTALAAPDEIKEQGEGHQHQEVWDGDRNMFHPEREEVAHFYRFHEIKEGRYYQPGDTPQTGPTGEAFEVDWDAVYNIRPNVRSSDFAEGSEAREALDDFNQTYSGMLHILDEAFNGQPEFLGIAVGAMYELKIKAIKLMQMPSGDGFTSLAPSFEYIPHEHHDPQGKIVIRRNGPYVVYGDLPLRTKSQIISEYGEPLTWRTSERMETEDVYALCRCGKSSTKPFCDGTHVRVNFDGTEEAETNTIAERQMIEEGTGITLKRDPFLCMSAGFCGTRFKRIQDMLEETDDPDVRARMMLMIEKCPSGAITYSIEPDGEDIEPSLPREVAVTVEGEYDGPLWITGGVKIERSDGEPFESRNRVTLCRCGRSTMKPNCDGTHRFPDEDADGETCN